MFITAIFIIAKKLERTHYFNRVMEQRIQKMWYLYTMENVSAIKSNDFMKFTGKWVVLENILSKVNQSQKNTHGMHSLISGY